MTPHVQSTWLGVLGALSARGGGELVLKGGTVWGGGIVGSWGSFGIRLGETLAVFRAPGDGTLLPVLTLHERARFASNATNSGDTQRGAASKGGR